MTSYRQNNASRGAGFTLVEILVVIVIIGMLAGLTTSVLVSARRSVRNSVVSTQEAQLSMALDEYKNKYGEYPPDMSDPDAVMRHIKKRWPRYNVPDIATFYNHVALGCRISSGAYGRNENMGRNYEPRGEHVWNLRRYVSSLVFWLGGLPDENGIPSGFYANPKSPLGVDKDGNLLGRPGRATREKPLYAFERKELSVVGWADGYNGGTTGNDVVYYPTAESELWDDSIGAYVYTPACTQGDLPIMYFRPSVGMGYADKYVFWGETATEGVTQACPYARTLDGANTVWYEARRFQLVHPGVDGYFGALEIDGGRTGLPATQPKTNCTLEDDDNITNFLEEGTLQSEYKDANGN